MKIYLNKLNESWVVDTFKEDWIKNNKNITTRFIFNSDIVWIISPWLWKNVPLRALKSKKVVCSIYHFDFDKFNNSELEEFKKRDKYVDTYHVISKKTEIDLRKFTNKKIFTIPFWIDGEKWFSISDKKTLRKKYKLSESSYIIGSFQRDTEGSDLKTPKLIKGPDILLDNILKIKKEQKNLIVLLAGKRRNYIIDKLEENKVDYKYFEMVNQNQLNEFYNILNLYIVSSRVEGGPQAILECALTKTPIVSTNVGVASEILHSESIYDIENFEQAKPNIDYAFKKVQEYVLPTGMKLFREMFSEVYEN